MIRAWRLSKARYAGDLTGQGAARDGQRWNQPGQRAVYLGMTAEISVLEVLVHLNGVLSAPLVLCGYDVPDTPGLIKEVDPTACPMAGTRFPMARSALLVATGCGTACNWTWLPSVVVPQARNLLLNPLHPAMPQVALVHQEPFRLDQRLA